MPSRAMKKMKSRRGIGSKERAATVEKKRKKVEAGKSWTKAVKAQKKTGGPTLSELIKRRSAAKKGTAEYAAAQNAINKAYGVKKRHKAPKRHEAPKESPKKLAEKALKGKDKTIIDVVKSVEKKQYGGRVARPAPRRGASSIPGRGARPAPPGINPVTPGPAQQRPVRSYEEGGKVEGSNPYGWPSRDARNGGKK